MQLVNEFVVPRGVDETWVVLTDVERIAPAMPGAELTEITPDGQIHGTVKVKVGPVTAKYGGVASFRELDEANHHMVLDATGKESSGRGRASAVITADLVPEGAQTRVKVTTDLTISGPLAQFGRGAIAEVSSRLLKQFVDQLQETVLADTPDGAAAGAAAAAAASAPATTAPATTAPAASAADPGTPAPAASSTASTAPATGGPGSAAAGPSSGASAAAASPTHPSTPSSAGASSADAPASSTSQAPASQAAASRAPASQAPAPPASASTPINGTPVTARASAPGAQPAAPQPAAPRPAAPRPAPPKSAPPPAEVNLLKVAAWPILKRALPLITVVAVVVVLLVWWLG